MDGDEEVCGQEMGEVAWRAYVLSIDRHRAKGAKRCNGRPLPPPPEWEALASRERSAWSSAAIALARHLNQIEGEDDV